MSIATFESPRVATQQFFPWVTSYENNIESWNSEESTSVAVCELPAGQPAHTECLGTMAAGLRPETASAARIAKPVRLGAVMIQLLKSYGITDEEIAAGLVAYAAKNGLAQAG